jgi:hypothetical protein
MFVSHLCSFSLPDVCLAGEHTVRSRPSSSAIRARPDFHFPDLVFSARRWFGFPAGKWSASSLVFWFPDCGTANRPRVFHSVPAPDLNARTVFPLGPSWFSFQLRRVRSVCKDLSSVRFPLQAPSQSRFWFARLGIVFAVLFSHWFAPDLVCLGPAVWSVANVECAKSAAEWFRLRVWFALVCFDLVWIFAGGSRTCFWVSRIKCSIFLSSYYSLMLVSWSHIKDVRWNVIEAVRSSLACFWSSLFCSWPYLHRVIFRCVYRLSNLIPGANNFSIVLRSWLS